MRRSSDSIADAITVGPAPRRASSTLSDKAFGRRFSDQGKRSSDLGSAHSAPRRSSDLGDARRASGADSAKISARRSSDLGGTNRASDGGTRLSTSGGDRIPARRSGDLDRGSDTGGSKRDSVSGSALKAVIIADGSLSSGVPAVSQKAGMNAAAAGSKVKPPTPPKRTGSIKPPTPPKAAAKA